MLAHSGYGAGNQYKEQNAMTASPGELTLMLIDGAIKDLKLEKKAIASKDFAGANTNSQKAQSIVGELMHSLDMRYDIAKQLMPLYEFILQTIIESNIKKDAQKVDTALELLSELRDTWREAIAINRKQTYGNAGSGICV